MYLLICLKSEQQHFCHSGSGFVWKRAKGFGRTLPEGCEQLFPHQPSSSGALPLLDPPPVSTLVLCMRFREMESRRPCSRISHKSVRIFFLIAKEIRLTLCMGRSCTLVFCSCAFSWVTGSLGQSLPLLLCPLMYHSHNYSWPKVFPAAIVESIQLKSANSLGVKINRSFQQTIFLFPRIPWLCVEWHRRLWARRLFPAAGVGFIGQKPPMFVGKETRELCKQYCTTGPWNSCRYQGFSQGLTYLQKTQNWSWFRKVLNQLKVYI